MDEQISRYFYEMSEAKNERTLKRIIRFCIFVIAGMLLIIIILASMLSEQHKEVMNFLSQYDYVGENIDIQNENGNANYIGRDGNINNGKDNGTQESDGEEEQQ